MKIARDLLTLALAVTFATVALVLIPIPNTSYYGSMPPTLSQGPIDTSDKSLVAVGLLSKKSVMDAPSKEIKPSQPPPTVPEHAALPVPQMPKVVEKVESDIKASVTKSAEMTGVPPSRPAPPSSMPAPAGPQPGPQPSATDSSSMSSVPSAPPPPPTLPPPAANSK
jgi:hypothetical protein